MFYNKDDKIVIAKVRKSMKKFVYFKFCMEPIIDFQFYQFFSYFLRSLS